MTPTVAIIEIVSTTKTSTDLLFTIFLLIGSLTWLVVIEWFVVGPADSEDADIDINAVSTTQGLYGERQKQNWRRVSNFLQQKLRRCFG